MTSNCRGDGDGAALGDGSQSSECGIPVGFYCHTPEDECINDTDCGSKIQAHAAARCVSSGGAGHWLCDGDGCLG